MHFEECMKEGKVVALWILLGIFLMWTGRKRDGACGRGGEAGDGGRHHEGQELTSQ